MEQGVQNTIEQKSLQDPAFKLYLLINKMYLCLTLFLRSASKKILVQQQVRQQPLLSSWSATFPTAHMVQKHPSTHTPTSEKQSNNPYDHSFGKFYSKSRLGGVQSFMLFMLGYIFTILIIINYLLYLLQVIKSHYITL